MTVVESPFVLLKRDDTGEVEGGFGEQLENIPWACYGHTDISFLFQAGGEAKASGVVIPSILTLSF